MSLLIRGKYEVAIFEGDVHWLSTWLGAVIVRLRRRPCLFWTAAYHRPERGLKLFIRRSFYRLASGLLVYSSRSRELAVRHGYPESRIVVIYNSVESPAGVSAVPALDALRSLAQRRSHVVGAVARLTPPKRLDVLLNAVAIANQSKADAGVVLVGSGPDEGRLLSSAAELGVDLLILPPIYDDTTLARVYEHIDVSVIPGSVGLTAIQSLKFGVPVITNDDMDSQMPEAEAIIEGINGSRCGTDAGSIASMILHWIERVSYSRDTVRIACERSLMPMWTPEHQARQIVRAVTRALRGLAIGNSGGQG